MSEGFATYFTLVYRNYAYGRDDFLDGLAAAKQRVVDFYADNPDYRIVHDNLSDMSQVTTGAGTYQKGGWTLHMLRGVVGEDAFWGGIQAYYREFRDRNATTADFRRVMEEASAADLGGFFDQWLYRGGWLELEGGWRYEASSRSIEVELNQVQDAGHTFRMPVEVGIAYPRESDGVGARDRGSVSTGLEIRVVRVDERTNRFTIPVEREPSRVVIDPNTWVLMDVDFGRRN